MKVAIASTEGDIEAAVGRVGGHHKALDTGHVEAGRFFDIDVLLRPHCRFEMLRVQAAYHRPGAAGVGDEFFRLPRSLAVRPGQNFVVEFVRRRDRRTVAPSSRIRR